MRRPAPYVTGDDNTDGRQHCGGAEATIRYVQAISHQTEGMGGAGGLRSLKEILAWRVLQLHHLRLGCTRPNRRIVCKVPCFGVVVRVEYGRHHGGAC